MFFRGFINPIVWVVNTYLFNDQVERNLGIAIVLYWDFVLLFPQAAFSPSSVSTLRGSYGKS